MDPLDQVLLSYIQSLHVEPLATSRKVNLPKFDVKSLEFSCSRALDELLPNIDIQHVQSIHVKLQFLYSIYERNYTRWLETVKKHQLLVVKLFEMKQYDMVYDQLENTYQQIATRLNCSVNKIDLSALVNGIPVVDCDPQLTQLIIAYHFFTLQWLAHSLAKNNLTKAERIEIIPGIPALFLTTSNQRLWINKAPLNEKYTSNCIKLIKAFAKVLGKQKMQFKLELNCLKVKLMEFTGDNDMESLDMLPGMERFIRDTKCIGSEYLQKSMHLDLKQAEVVRLANCVSKTKSSSKSSHDIPSTSKVTDYDSIKSTLDTFTDLQEVDLPIHRLLLLDSVTLFCQANLSPHLVPILEQLYQIFKCHAQYKRIRNVSNLLFKLGNKTNDIYLLELAINYEFTILQHQSSDKNFELLVGKLKLIHQYSPEMMKVLLKACELSSKIDSITIELLVEMLQSNVELVECMNEVDEQFRFNLVIKLIENMGNCKTQKMLVCNSLVEKVTFLNDKLTLQVQISYYNVAGIEHLNLKAPKNCTLLAFVGIEMAKMCGKDWSKEVLFRVCEKLEHWALHFYEIEEFEVSIVKNAILFLEFNGLYSEVKEITKNLVQVPILHDHLKIFLHFHLCHVSEKLSMHSCWGDSIYQLQQLISLTKYLQFQDVVNYKMESIKYHIAHDFATSQAKFKSLVAVLKERPEFNPSLSKSLPILDKLRNFLLLAKVQLLAARMKTKDRVGSHSCIKKAMRILYLISKKCPSYLNISVANELIWETNHLLFDLYELAINSLIGLGLSRNLPAYLNEWKKLNDLVEAPLINQVNKYKIQIFGMLLNSDKFVDEAEDDQEFVKSNPSVRQLKFIMESLRDKHDIKTSLHDENHHPTLQLSPYFLYINLPDDLQQLEDSFTCCIRQLNDFKTFGSFPDHVQMFPSITNGEVTLHPDALKIFIELGRIKDCLLTKLQHTESSIFEQKRRLYLLSQCTHLISSISAYRGKDLLYQLYFIQDRIKSRPFADNKRLATLEEKELAPDVHEEEPVPYDQQLSQFKIALSMLPPNWNVVTIDICERTGDLLISKIRAGNLPTFIRLSVTRFKQRESVGTLRFDEMKREFKRIFQENRKSTLYSTTSLVKTTQDRKKWWKTRFTLDYELQDLILHVERFWFGGFRGIFEPVGSTFGEFRLDLIKILRSHISEKIEHSISLNEVVYECFYGLESYDRACIDDLLAFLMEILSFHLDVEATRVNFEKLHESIASLIDKCQNRQSSDHIVLIPSARCSFFPWESLLFLRSKSVCRMPSVSMLVDALNQQSRVKKNEVYYLINPGGDLKTSEQRFQPVIEKCKTWKGLAGVKPNEEKIVDDILDSKLFVYIGHGGCDQYVKPSALFLATKHTHLPPCLLIGCSSGELQDHGRFEPLGGIFNWLNCGSPLVLANLWDVTDKDIDAFTLSMFSKWGLIDEDGEKINIAEAVRLSREVCILKYLNGSAPIIYGLPLMTS